MRIVHVVGTRPNFMKVAPLVEALSRERKAHQTIVHTGQHYDRLLSDVFFEDLQMPYPDHFLEVGSGTHGEQTARVILALEPLLEQLAPEAVVVPGDVNSTLGAALAAVKLGLPVVHLEAGLRSRDRTMPEEHNRVLTDHVSELLLAPSRDAVENLRAENIPAERIALVGNTMIDSLRAYEDEARALDVAQEFGVSDHVLVTLHRPALVDDMDVLAATLEVLDEIAASRPVLFPVHPRTRAAIDGAGLRYGEVQLVPPQSYLRFLSLEQSAAAVVTDSGGVQEETTVLGVPCFTLRDNTERPITVEQGTNRVLGVGRAGLGLLREAMRDLPRRQDIDPPELWDGQAGRRAAAEIVARLGSAETAEEESA